VNKHPTIARRIRPTATGLSLMSVDHALVGCLMHPLEAGAEQLLTRARDAHARHVVSAGAVEARHEKIDRATV